MTTTAAPRVLTWDDLADREPRLVALRREVERETARGRPHYCANAAWYGTQGGTDYRHHVTNLVGWESRRPDPVLRSRAAYDVVYRTLYALLPGCRDCGCSA